MKKSAVLFLIILFSLTALAQKSKKPRSPGKNKLTATKPLGSEKEEFEKAIAQTEPAPRVEALQKFIKSFPKSDEKTRAQELIVSARAELGEQKLQAGETEDGVKLFKLAVKEAPAPLSDKLFTEVILTFPTNLFWRGQQAAALEIADLIEEKANGNAKQLLGLATFYLGTENAAEARRLADKAIAIDANLPAAYQTLGLANRMSFQLDEAVIAYAKALELDPDSTVSKRSLAEMKRSVGKADEAAALYREILAKDEADLSAQTGLALSLFSAEKRAEAEVQMAKTLEANPNNLFLLVGAAYWYAAHNEGAKAVELAQKAIAVEPRYTWAHIALARGLMAQKQPLEAEKALLTARQYGNFPTLDYEIAAARAQAGFYREAAEGLKKSFTIEDDLLVTRLGGRVTVEAKNFTELLSLERRASIFEPKSADDEAAAERLKSLLDFSQKLDAAEPNETEISAAASGFVKGDDKMKVHRQLYVADRLLEKRVALPKALEIAQATVGGADAGLDVSTPTAAVLADDLYQSRVLANSRGEVLLMPDVSRQTLSAILRGRIEEIAGWSLFQQNQATEATIRLKRAVSVLPEKSTWWRSSLWRLGAALEADGKQAEALDAYIKSYTSAKPEASKYLVIESLYQKINGSNEGLDAKVGAKPAILATISPRTTETVAQTTTPLKTGLTPEIKPESSPETTPAITEEKPPAVEIKSTPVPETLIKTETPIKTETTTDVSVESEPTPASSPEVKPTIEATPETTVEAIPEVTPEAASETTPTPENQLIVETSPTPAETKPEVSPTPETVIENSSTPPTNSETKRTVEAEKNETLAKTEVETKPRSNSLFEPIVISVPKPEKPKSAKTKEKTPENIEPVQTEEAEQTENEPAKTEKTGETRPRVVVSKNEAIPECKITVSQDNVSVLNNGGNVGILVALEGAGENDKVTMTSSSPRDVTAVLDKGIGAISKQAFFVIKSISSKKGDFTITFESACGKKEIPVKVR